MSLLSSLTTVMDMDGRAVIIPLFDDILRNTGLDVEILDQNNKLVDLKEMESDDEPVDALKIKELTNEVNENHNNEPKLEEHDDDYLEDEEDEDDDLDNLEFPEDGNILEEEEDEII